MIYYNLDSQYPGDVTKHCGLTIDEVDNNFYELEQMVHELGPCDKNPKQRFWCSSGDDGNFPFINTLEREMVDNNTCKIKGTVKNGELLFGIDNLIMFGFSVLLYGETFVNDTLLPNNIMYPTANCAKISAKVENLPNHEIGVHIKVGNRADDTIYIETINRRLYIRCEYGGESFLNGTFVFDNELIIEDMNPSLWRDEYVWTDSYIWETENAF